VPAKTGDRDRLLAFGVRQIADWMSCGQSQVSIARACGVSISSMSDFCRLPENQPIIEQGRRDAAKYWDDRVDEVMDSPMETPGQIARARELAQHYRWRAKCYDKKRYGDKQEVEHSGTMAQNLTVEFVKAPGKK
jgi:hypothetical protein